MAIFSDITDSGGTGNINWGHIGGDLSDQADLKNALDGKVNLDGSNATFSNLSNTAKENLNNKIDCIDFTSAISRTWNTEYTTTNAVYIQVGVSISIGNPVFLDIQGVSITILAEGAVGSRPNQFFKIPPNTTWKVRGGDGDGFINEYQFL